MKFLRFILTFSVLFNLLTQASSQCDMKACKVSKEVITCCKKETAQKIECCCVEMKCKTTIKYNDMLPFWGYKVISIQHDYLSIQNAGLIINKANPFLFSTKYFHWANPPSKNNIPLLT